MLKKQKMKVLLETVWDIGQRIKNQDSILAMEIRCDKHTCVLAVVCDGIGGLEEGEYASGYIVQKMQSWFYEKAVLLKHGVVSKKVRSSMERALYQIHCELVEYSRKRGIKMGSTCSIVLLVNQNYEIFHYGDSRIYKWEEKRNTSLLTIDDVESNGRGLTRAIGIGEWSLPFWKKGKLGKRESLLLCTDGFYRKMKTEQREYLMNMNGIDTEEIIKKRLSQMVRILLERGEKDNMSAIVIGKVGECIDGSCKV